MQQGVSDLLLDTRRAADHDHRAFFGIGLGGGVDHLQSPDAIGDADRAQAAHACIGIGGVTGGLLIAGVDHFYLAVVQLFIKSQHVVPGNSKGVPQPVLV